ncbi:MAG: hypothetical protein QGF53_09520 [Alphaproteobacteria bacterium]|jgi:hypothetical protein|nr:hypothetical protein [Alphaproteobacteria bacterium]
MVTVELEREEEAETRKPRRAELARPARQEPEPNPAETAEPIWFAHW